MMGELADYLVEHEANFRKARLPALYSDFRPQRTLNPDGYQANISAWTLALSRLASEGLLSHHGSKPSVLVLELDESLRRSLENRQFGQPLALGAVINEAAAGKDLIPLQSFLQSGQSIYEDAGWSQVPWNVMGWTLRQLGVVDPNRGEDKMPRGQYVIVKNVEAASQELGKRMADKTSRFDRVFTKAQFEASVASTLVKDQRLSETDLDVLLKFMTRDKEMIEHDGQTIRIRGAGEQGGITEEDASIASIKELTASLHHQVDLLNKRMDELDQEARSAVLRKNRIAALAALKSKKLAEASLSRRYATLNQLEEVAAKLVQASDQIQLVKIMESSAGALKSLNAQIGGAERVDSAIARLRQQMGETDEVAAILAESTGVVVDESEIDEELEAMEKLQKEKEQEAQRLRENTRRREEEAREAREAAELQKKLDELGPVPVEIAPEPERSQLRTPTSETGFAALSIGGESRERTREQQPLPDN